ncbi:glycosyltransferase family 2 protein [Sphingobacterium multivorum]|uniref:glycosyltransferase family 2 protein n=1 Tax=Sphingobacterium multivorum TaxID=28454 RepID=UPI00368E2349
MKFSLCVSAYKDVFFKECLNSLINQNYDNYEIIILNDCSPGCIREISNAVDHPNLYYYENEKNVGAIDLVDNWNKLLDLCSGDYIVIVGDDDYLSPDYLSNFHQLILANPQYAVFHCRSYIVDEKSTEFKLTNSWPNNETVLNSMYHRLSHLRNWYISDFVYSTKILRAIGGFVKLPLAWASDDLSFYCAALEHGVCHTEIPLLFYRESSYTISNSNAYLLKLDAVNYEYKLTKELVSKINPQTKADEILKSYIDLNFDRFFDRKKEDCIIQALKGSKSILYKIKTLFALLKNKSKASLTTYNLIKSILKSFS